MPDALGMEIRMGGTGGLKAEGVEVTSFSSSRANSVPLSKHLQKKEPFTLNDPRPAWSMILYPPLAESLVNQGSLTPLCLDEGMVAGAQTARARAN